MLILDDVISLETQDKIESTMLGNKFPWFYSKDMEYDFVGFELDNMVASTGFNHAFYYNNRQLSPHLNLVYSVLTQFLASQNMEIDKLIRCKANLTTPQRPFSSELHNIPHVDDILDHYVLLYYTNDSDGDTVFFNEKFEKWLTKPTVMQKVSPKKGRVVFFHGDRYHCASNPVSNDVRVIINYNFTVKP